MTDQPPTEADSVHGKPWLVTALFMIVPLIIGSIPPALVFGMYPASTPRLGLDAVPIPAWVFISVWLVAYPGIGLAGSILWKRRLKTHGFVPLGLLSAGFLCTLSFWVTNGLLMTATLDAINLVLSWTIIWAVAHWSRTASLALLPWGLWMPITLAFKLYALAQ